MGHARVGSGMLGADAAETQELVGKAGSITSMCAMETLGREKLETLVKEWRRLLGLEHWTIRLELIRFTRPYQSGDIKVDPVHKTALLLLSETPFRDEEETIVHELVHLVLWPLDMAAMDLVEVVGPEGSPAREFAQSTVFRALEPVTEQLTRSLLLARGHQGSPVWQVLENEAADRVQGGFETHLEIIPQT